MIVGKKYWIIETPFSYGETSEGCVTESKYTFETFDTEADWIARINAIKGDGWYESQQLDESQLNTELL